MPKRGKRAGALAKAQRFSEIEKCSKLVLEKQDDDHEWSKIERYSFKQRDAKLLLGCRWLNDNCVNSYFKLIEMRSKKTKLKLKVTPSQFVTALKSGGYDRVQRWLRDVHDVHLVLFPYCFRVGTRTYRYFFFAQIIS